MEMMSLIRFASPECEARAVQAQRKGRTGSPPRCPIRAPGAQPLAADASLAGGAKMHQIHDEAAFHRWRLRTDSAGVAPRPAPSKSVGRATGRVQRLYRNVS